MENRHVDRIDALLKRVEENEKNRQIKMDNKLTICVVCGKGHPRPPSWPVGYPILCEECNK